MYKIKEIKFKNFIKEYDLNPTFNLPMNIGVNELKTGKIEYKKIEIHVLKNALRATDLSYSSLRFEYLKQIDNKLIAFKKQYDPIKFNKLRWLYSADYRKRVKNVRTNSQKIIKELSDKQTQISIFNEMNEDLRDKKNSMVKIIDLPFKVGDSFYAICLNGRFDFDGIKKISDFIRPIEYKIIDISVSKNYSKKVVDFDIRLNLQACKEDDYSSHNKESISFVYSEKEDLFKIKQGYSNLKFFDNEKDFKDKYNYLLEKISNQLKEELSN